MVSVEEELLVEETENTDDEVSQDSRYTIMTYPADYTLWTLYEKWRSGQLIIPDFQRNYFWNDTQASRLIESFLLGLPVPQIFLHRYQSDPELTLIDGHHRLMTVFKYLDDEFRLKGVSSKWDGHSYKSLIADDQLLLCESVLRAIIIRQILPDDNWTIHSIYVRLNTGGTQLNNMEIRRVMFGGAASNFLERLNENPDWRAIIGMPQPVARYRDLELILRILALTEGWRDYRKPMKDFITKYMQVLDNVDAGKMSILEQRFVKVCQAVRADLGEKPFHLSRRLNPAALDSLMGCLMILGDSQEIDIQHMYRMLLDDEAFMDSVTRNTSDEYVVLRRFEIVQSAFDLR